MDQTFLNPCCTQDEVRASEQRLSSQGVHKQTDYFIRGPFEKFVDSPYYSKSELCGMTSGCFHK